MVPQLSDYSATAALRPGAVGAAPTVSVVTITFNAAATLRRTIESLHAQTFQDFEHVVVDGGSKDQTATLARSLLRPRDFLLSEADRGISDAFNKGVALARGRFVQFLNADDWASPDQLATAVAAIEGADADFVFGDLIFYEGGRPSFRYVGEAAYAAAIDRRMPALNHPTALARRACFERIGLFDIAYRCAMDYDWFLRLHRAGGRGLYDRAILGHMTHDGVSNLQFRRTVDEVRRIATAHGRPALIAAIEARYRSAKIAASHQVKQRARPLYQLIRSVINRSYAPIAEPAIDVRPDRPPK